MKTAFLSLGSNLNNPVQQITDAVGKIQQHPNLHEVLSSSLYHSSPLGPQDQPDFVNTCVRLKTPLLPLELLDVMQGLEDEANRVRVRRWGERSLDVDIIYYEPNEGEPAWQCSRLTIPHPEYAERDFVLVPLREVLDSSWQIDIEALCEKLSDSYIK